MSIFAYRIIDILGKELADLERSVLEPGVRRALVSLVSTVMTDGDLAAVADARGFDITRKAPVVAAPVAVIVPVVDADGVVVGAREENMGEKVKREEHARLVAQVRLNPILYPHLAHLI